MTLGDFLEYLGFREYDKWIGYGNDFLLLTQTEAQDLKFNFSDDLNTVNDDVFYNIGKILAKKGRMFNEAFEFSDYVDLSKRELKNFTRFKYLQTVASTFNKYLPSDFVARLDDKRIVVTYNGIPFTEDVATKVRQYRHKVDDELGKDVYKLYVTDGIQEINISNL